MLNPATAGFFFNLIFYFDVILVARKTTIQSLHLSHDEICKVLYGFVHCLGLWFKQ